MYLHSKLLNMMTFPFQFYFCSGLQQAGVQLLLSCPQWEFGPQCYQHFAQLSTCKPQWFYWSAERHIWEYVFLSNLMALLQLCPTLSHHSKNPSLIHQTKKNLQYLPQKFQKHPMPSSSRSASVISACLRALSSWTTQTSKWRTLSTLLWVYITIHSFSMLGPNSLQNEGLDFFFFFDWSCSWIDISYWSVEDLWLD